MKKLINTTIVSALALSTASIMSAPPLANAEELSKDVIKSIEFLDKEGKPISGTISNDDIGAGDLNLKVDIDFPDDAKPGDYVDITTNQKVEYAFTKNIDLLNSDNVPIATVSKEGDTTLRITLNENAKDMINRSAELMVSASGNPFTCSKEDIKDNPLKVKVGDFDYPLSTRISIRPKACEISVNPHPEGVIPIPQMQCNAVGGYLRYTDKYTFKGRDYKNVLLGFPPFGIFIQPGNIEMFKNITIDFDANSKNQPNPRSFMMTLDEFKTSLKDGKIFFTYSIPSVYFEDKDPNDDDYDKARDVLPTARLFPGKTYAASFKKEVISKYGEDVYYNKNDAFWNTNETQKKDIYDLAVKEFNKFAAENSTITSYKPEVGKFTIKIKNANDISKMVTPENEDWKKLNSNNKNWVMGISFNDGGNSNPLYAPYQGAGLYSGVKLSYAGDLGDQYNGNCVTGDDWFVGEISGAGRGEPLPPATFEVKKEAEKEKITISDDNKYTANYKISVTNTSKTTDSTTSEVLDTPNFPEGFNIDTFSSNGKTIKPDDNGKYKISDGVVLKAGETKTFDIKIDGTTDNPTEEALTAAGKCDIEGTGNKDLGLFNVVSMKDDKIKENNDACIVAEVPEHEAETPDNPDDTDDTTSTTPSSESTTPTNKEDDNTNPTTSKPSKEPAPTTSRNKEDTPDNSDTPDSSTTESTTKSIEPSKTTSKTTPVQSRNLNSQPNQPVRNQETPRNFNPVQQPVNQVSEPTENAKVDTGGNITKNIAVMIKQLFS